uniref:Uncharacterized protein n=1 Tax=Rhodocyclus tenuis TaxID=1066 RepID=A0A840FZ54_RHOTE|nr:hypothetical protein [Rhodocyclus tenuis]
MDDRTLLRTVHEMNQPDADLPKIIHQKPVRAMQSRLSRQPDLPLGTEPARLRDCGKFPRNNNYFG